MGFFCRFHQSAGRFGLQVHLFGGYVAANFIKWDLVAINARGVFLGYVCPVLIKFASLQLIFG